MTQCTISLFEIRVSKAMIQGTNSLFEIINKRTPLCTTLRWQCTTVPSVARGQSGVHLTFIGFKFRSLEKWHMNKVTALNSVSPGFRCISQQSRIPCVFHFYGRLYAFQIYGKKKIPGESFLDGF